MAVRARGPANAWVPAYTIAAGHSAIQAATAVLEEVYPGSAGPADLHPRGRSRLRVSEQLPGVKTLVFSFAMAGEKRQAPVEYLRIGGLREEMRAWGQLWRLLAGGPHRLAAAGSGQHD